MRKLLTLAAAVALAACAGRTKEEAGAAPARDTMRVDTSSTAGFRVDTSQTTRDTTMGNQQNPGAAGAADTSTARRDTSAAGANQQAAPNPSGAAGDTTMTGRDTTSMGADTATTQHNMPPDSTGGNQPSNQPRQ